MQNDQAYHIANADGNDVHMTGMDKKKKKTKKNKKDELDNLKREVEMVSVPPRLISNYNRISFTVLSQV